MDHKVQVPAILTEAGYECTLIGKVADIVYNEKGTSISCVPTEECLKHTVEALDQMEMGFICTNIQETDLAGHSQSSGEYRRILEMADRGIGQVLAAMESEDILLIQADHGNDPTYRGTDHTREFVPLIAYSKRFKSGEDLGIRKTFSDIGASVADNFKVKMPEHGESFLNRLK